MIVSWRSATSSCMIISILILFQGWNDYDYKLKECSIFMYDYFYIYIIPGMAWLWLQVEGVQHHVSLFLYWYYSRDGMIMIISWRSATSSCMIISILILLQGWHDYDYKLKECNIIMYHYFYIDIISGMAWLWLQVEGV